MKICLKCKRTLNFDSFHKAKNRKDGLYPYCKECKRSDDKKYRENNTEKLSRYREINKEKRRDQWKEWYALNKDAHDKKRIEFYYKNKKRINFSKISYFKNRKKNDEIFRFRQKISVFIRDAYKRNRFRKNKKAEEILGCSIEFFRKFIENKFKEGMSWDNHGVKGWHIDHIIPLSSAKTIDDLLKLNHHSNLQPLWYFENIKKGNKYNV